MSNPFLAEANPSPIPDKGAGLRILVVDERRDIRTALRAVLDDDGHAYGNYFTVQSRIAYEF